LIETDICRCAHCAGSPGEGAHGDDLHDAAADLAMLSATDGVGRTPGTKPQAAITPSRTQARRRGDAICGCLRGGV
jgi:hypothetical protein